MNIVKDLTKREYFAGIFLQSLISNLKDNFLFDMSTHFLLSEEAVRLADALLCQLEKEAK